MSWGYKGGIKLPGYDPLNVANAPTIGTATAGTAACASVTFTAPACTGGSVISTYTVFSNCGAKTATGASSPLTVTGLTVGTSYTFKVIATNIYGPSYPSAASNSITAATVTCATYTTAGTYSWVAPAGVTSVAVVAVGSAAGPGAGLGWKNNIAVTPGNSYSVVVGLSGSGQNSYFINTSTVMGGGGGAISSAGGIYVGDGGGNGGAMGCAGGCYFRGGGGAGGYAGNGGKGANSGCGSGASGAAGSGGGGGGGSNFPYYVTPGGGVGLYGQGSSGAGGNGSQAGRPGSGGSGVTYGGGGGDGAAAYGAGAVRIVWCSGGARGTPSFPSTNVGP